MTRTVQMKLDNEFWLVTIIISNEEMNEKFLNRLTRNITCGNCQYSSVQSCSNVIDASSVFPAFFKTICLCLLIDDQKSKFTLQNYMLTISSNWEISLTATLVVITSLVLPVVESKRRTFVRNDESVGDGPSEGKRSLYLFRRAKNTNNQKEKNNETYRNHT